MIDEIDVKILDILQKDGRTSRSDLADRVHLSVPSVSERLRKLEENGIILRYTAVVDHQKAGKDITAFIVVIVDSSKHYHQFVEHAAAIPEILECHAITGEGSHLLKIRTANTVTLEKLLATIQSWNGVTGTRTQLVLSTSKETNYIQISHPKQHP